MTHTSSWRDKLPRRPEAVAPAPSIPEAPSWLSADALALWREHSPVWAELGALGKLDTHAIGMLCEEMAMFHRHRDAVLSEGALVVYPHFTGANPNAALRDNAAKRIVLLLRQCGLTRASRAGTAMQESAPSPLSLFAKESTPAPAAGRWAHLKPDAAGRIPGKPGYDPETA